MELNVSKRVITVRLKITVRNQTSGQLLGDGIDCAQSSFERRRGLLGRTELAYGGGLWLDRCEAVHSFFMKFPIDVLHLDRTKKVAKIRSSMKPWRVSISLTGKSVLELPAGTAARTRTAPGDQLAFQRVAAALALCGLLLTGCAKRQIAVAAPVSSYDRQVRNALDAGDGDYQLKRLREKVIAAPSDLTFRLDLASAYEAKGYPELALDHYRMAAEKFPDNAEPELRLARCLVSSGHAAPAIAVYADFLASHESAAPLYSAWLGIMRDDTGDWKGGETAHRDALRRAELFHQDFDYLHNNLGFCLLSQGRATEAAEEFRRALKLNPSSEIARDNLASALTANPSEAIVHFQSISEPAAAHNNMAALLMEQGKYPEARKELDRALSYDRAYPAAMRNLKLLSELDGKPAMIPVSPAAPSRLARVKLALHKMFGGTSGEEPGSKNEKVIETASRSEKVQK